MKRLCPAILLLLNGTLALAAEVEMDMHFRPFSVEPADRVDFGHGHLVAGIRRDFRPEQGTRYRDAVPVEATLGLAAGFSVVLATEAAARSAFDDGQSSAATGHEMRLRYSLPAWNNVHFALLTGQGRRAGENTKTHTNGYSFTFDTGIGDIGFGQTWDRQLPGETQRKRETGINVFRQGLGPDGKWGLAAELRRTRTGNNTHHQHWLLGTTRLLAPGVLADVAIGGSSGEQRSQLITAGLSWFF